MQASETKADRFYYLVVSEDPYGGGVKYVRLFEMRADAIKYGDTHDDDSDYQVIAISPQAGDALPILTDTSGGPVAQESPKE